MALWQHSLVQEHVVSALGLQAAKGAVGISPEESVVEGVQRKAGGQGSASAVELALLPLVLKPRLDWPDEARVQLAMASLPYPLWWQVHAGAGGGGWEQGS